MRLQFPIHALHYVPFIMKKPPSKAPYLVLRIEGMQERMNEGTTATATTITLRTGLFLGPRRKDINFGTIQAFIQKLQFRSENLMGVQK